MRDDPHRYDDLLDLPHHQSASRPHMGRLERAAQFSPSAALTGYGALVEDTARLTDSRPVPGDEELRRLDETFRALAARPEPAVTLTRFIPDEKKAGGRLETLTGRIRRIDPVERLLWLRVPDSGSRGLRIALDDVIAVEAEPEV